MEVLTGTIMEAVFTIVGILIAAAVSYFVPKLKRQLDILADKDNLGIIDSLVDKAVEYVEEEFKGEEGRAKFEKATERASMLISRYGIEASDELIRSSIQKGWKNMQDKQDK